MSRKTHFDLGLRIADFGLERIRLETYLNQAEFAGEFDGLDARMNV